MLTVISLEELEKFYRDHKLSKSESFDFLSTSTQNFLGKVFTEENETTMAKLIHVHSVGGVEINHVAKEVLDDANDDLLAYLPMLESEQILIITGPSDKMLMFSDEVLEELESSSISTEEEQEFYKELLLDKNAKGDSCTYTVSGAIDLKDVVAIVYPESLEERIAELKDANKDRDVLFKTTALFN